MTTPMAVVFQDEFGEAHELWAPPGFAVVVANGGILVTHMSKTVAGILSARPLQGEGDAEVHEQQGVPEDSVDERGQEPHGDVRDPQGASGEGAGPGAAEGSGVPGNDDGGDPPSRCDGHVVADEDDDYFTYCSPGLGCNSHGFRAPGPDDVPGVTV